MYMVEWLILVLRIKCYRRFLLQKKVNKYRFLDQNKSKSQRVKTESRCVKPKLPAKN